MATFQSVSKKHFMLAVLLFLGLFMPSFKTTGAQSIGVCYGRNGNGLPSEQDVINLYKANRIGRMRLYDPVPAALNALRGSNIEIILNVPNPDLQSLSLDASAATSWVQKNIIDYTPGVNFKYIAVGNEVDPNNGNSQYVNFVLPAMQNIHNAIKAAGLNQIRVSTATYSGLIAPNSSPPSLGSFDDSVKNFINPIVTFLAQNNLPLLVNIYPYFSHNEGNLPYALFTATEVVVTDPEGNRGYRNLFDALVDVQYSALEKSGGSNVEIVVSESGWPSAGAGGKDASVENAQTYYQNLINHVRGGNGTPKRPGRAIETYLFAMFDEDKKLGDEVEKHFGLFTPSQQPKYQLSFN